MNEILNRKSGLLGITGRYSDRRDIIKAADQGDEDCKLAFEIECYRLKKYIGAYSAALENLNAITFTGGTGERSPRYREKICKGLEQLGIEIDNEKNSKAKDTMENEISTDHSKVKVFVIPTNEEIVIAEDTAALLEGRYAPHWEFKYSFDRQTA
jgi:acetate kinase